jgi:hypothetical protein
MAKITMKEKIQRSNYFEVNYLFVLYISSDQLSKTGESATKEVSGMAGYKNGTSIDDIQKDLEKRYKEEQSKIERDDSFEFYGKTWDGEAWK